MNKFAKKWLVRWIDGWLVDRSVGRTGSRFEGKRGISLWENRAMCERQERQDGQTALTLTNCKHNIQDSLAMLLYQDYADAHCEMSQSIIFGAYMFFCEFKM